MLPCHTGCAYKREILGDCHIQCAFAWLKAPQEIQNQFPQSTSSSPRTQRWFRFPLNFDPVWGPDTCAAFAKEADPSKVHQFSPLEMIGALLR